MFVLQQEMEAPPEGQPESERERVSAGLHSEAARRRRPQLIQQFGNVLHHEISSGTYDRTAGFNKNNIFK